MNKAGTRYAYNKTISLPVTMLLIGAIVNDGAVIAMFVLTTREEAG